MKVAYHFSVDHPSLSGTYYGYRLMTESLRALLGMRSWTISTKVLDGDLLLSHVSSDRERTSDGYIERFNRDKYSAAVEAWLAASREGWSRLLPDLPESFNGNVAVLCFETLPHYVAEALHRRLVDLQPAYVGATEIDESVQLLWELYSNCLSPRLRLIGSALTVFWDGVSEDSKDHGLATGLADDLGVPVTFESLEGRHTIFDSRHGFVYARRAAECRRRFGHLLAFVADEVIDRLGDAAPELPDRLWSGLNAFERAETSEDLAQVAASCRRALEYVADQVFPSSDTPVDGRPVGPAHYKNRLLAFAQRERKSSTSIDLVLVSTEMLAQQLDKLMALANKGVHADLLREEARRCLLRTLLALDDIASMKSGPFPIKTEIAPLGILGEES